MQLGDFGSALSDVVVHFGYGAVFVLIFLESAGVPLPGETALVTASVLAATTEGLDISLIIIAAAAGAILGDNLGFWVGRRYGFDFLRRYGRYIRLSEDRILICQWLFRQYGGRVVFLVALPRFCEPMRRSSQGLSTFLAVSSSFGMRAVDLSGPRFLGSAVTCSVTPLSLWPAL
jgi:membrane protein DedA with SNARE-associated domain